MIITEVELNGFKSYEYLQWELPLQNGLYYLSGDNQESVSLGSNGSGKTSLFDAICWCLFEKTGKGSKAKKLLNYNHKSEFFPCNEHKPPEKICSNSKHYHQTYSVLLKIEGNPLFNTVYRSWQPNKLLIDNNPTTNERLEELIGMSYDQFLHSTYFTQKAESGFIDLSPTEKLNFLSEVFQLEEYITAVDRAKLRLNKYSHERDIKIELQKSHHRSIDYCSEQISDLITRQSEWADLQTSKLKTLKNQLGELNEQIQDVLIDKESEADARSMVTEIEADKKALETELLPITKAQQENEYQLRSNASKSEELFDQLKELVEGKEGVDKTKIRVCPSCQQEITKEHVIKCTEDLQVIINKLKMEAVKLDSFKIQLAKSHQVLSNRAARINDELKQARNLLSEFTGREVALTLLKGQIKSVELQIRENEEAVNPYTGQIDGNRSNSTTFKAKLVECSEAITNLDTIVSGLEFWIKHMPLVRLQVLSNIVQELEITLNQGFSALGLNDWTVTVDTERDLVSKSTKKELNLKVSNSSGKEVDIDMLSGGEQQRIRLAADIGISELIKSQIADAFDLEMYDEPSKALSVEGISHLLEFFGNLGNNKRILYADHKILDLGNFTSTIRIVKNELGISTIEGKRELVPA